MAVIEYARHVAASNANSTEVDAQSPHPVIHLMEHQKDRHEEGRRPCGSATTRAPSRRARFPQALRRKQVLERHRHRYKVQQRLPRAAGGRGLGLLGCVAERTARRDDRAARPSVVRRDAGAPRVQVAADGLPSALQGLHQGRPPGEREATPAERGHAQSREGLSVVDGGGPCRFHHDRRRRIARRHRRTVRHRIAGHGAAARRAAPRARPRPRRGARLQIVVRQGEPHLARRVPRRRDGRGAPHPRRHPWCDRATRADRRARRLADRGRRRGSRRAADAGVPLPADGLHSRRRIGGEAGQLEEGPVPVALRDAACRREGSLDRQRGPARDRARLRVRLQQPRLRYALAAAARRDRLPGRLRRDPQRAATGRPGDAVGRRSPLRRTARARRRRRRLRRRLHGSARGSDNALSDGATSVSLDDVPALWRQLLAIDAARREGHP